MNTPTKESIIVNLSTLRQKKPFNVLFPINPDTLERIIADMRINGFDFSKPLDVWGDIIVEGNTRYTACKAVGIKEVSVYFHDFQDEEQALDYAIHCQRDRRNITDSEILCCVETLDTIKNRGRRKEKAQGCAITGKGKSAKTTALKIGVSTRKIEQTRTIIKHADKHTLDQVKKGKVSINKAYKKTQQKRNKPRKEKGRIKPDNTFKKELGNIAKSLVTEWQKSTKYNKDKENKAMVRGMITGLQRLFLKLGQDTETGIVKYPEILNIYNDLCRMG